MKRQLLVIAAAASVFFAGCINPDGSPERGPDGTIAYYIQVETSEPGARVEANGEHLGVTPLRVKVFGDKDGTFHNFGTDDFTLKIYPVRPGQRSQIRTFRTGRWFSQEDRIPKHLYIDLNEKSEGFSIDLPPTKEPKP